MPGANIYFIIFSVLLLAGGFMGSKMAGSKMSLIMGILSALIISLGNYLSLHGNLRLGNTLMLIMSLLLCGVFLKRLLATKAFMPSGMLILLSVVAVILAALRLTNQ